MRLINTTSLKLEEFFDGDIPPYAILSHTWGAEEITFEDWIYAQQQNPTRWGWVHSIDEVNLIKAKPGYTKIANACRQAVEDRFEWIWVDTNCINKSNSQELSEAINSMFRWYREARVCYVFLADVSPSTLEDCVASNSEFRASRWFTRGWTLQELIAPSRIKFFSSSWTLISSKLALAAIIEEITTIPVKVLQGRKFSVRARGRSVAETFSWAASRRTTRVEDMAYCLMGLLGVNMPLLYGEHQNAFHRLQLEIARSNSDLTFLVWQDVLSRPKVYLPSPWEGYALTFRKAFADSPKAFSFPRGITGTDPGWLFYQRAQAIPVQINNLGLSLRLPLVETLVKGFVFAVLPYKQDLRELWMPLEWRASYRCFVRVDFPAPTFAVMGAERHVQNEADITLCINDELVSSFSGPGSASLPPPTVGGGDRATVSILVVFPSGCGKYRVVSQYPQPDPMKRAWGSLMALYDVYIDDNHPHFGFGALEFQQPVLNPQGEAADQYGMPIGEPIAVFFAIECSSRDHRQLQRWTTRDISVNSGDRGAIMDLETRARGCLRSLIRPSSSGPVGWDSDWVHGSSLGENTDSADAGFVLLEERPYDPSNAQFVLPGGVEREASLRSSAEHLILVAQIAFPGQSAPEAPGTLARRYHRQRLSEIS